MRAEAPFRADDLRELEALLEQASRVVPMLEIAAEYDDDPLAIGLRHDVDNEITSALAFAEWEAERGYRATYFVLHTAPYWHDPELLRETLARIAAYGHEIGFHLNAIPEALRERRDPLAIVAEAVGRLRSWGYPLPGVVAHGDNDCHRFGFVNDEIFLESPRPNYGAPDRLISGYGWALKLRPVSRAAFGFIYDPNWLPRGAYLSDSGGRWSQPFLDWSLGLPGQLHMLVHPCWWAEAFEAALV